LGEKPKPGWENLAFPSIAPPGGSQGVILAGEVKAGGKAMGNLAACSLSWNGVGWWLWVRTWCIMLSLRSRRCEGVKGPSSDPHHARRWYVHIASAFPLAHHYRAVLAWGS